MRTVAFTAFRQRASEMFDAVERGETLRVMRHGRLVAEIRPAAEPSAEEPAWRRPGLRLPVRGGTLAEAVLAERQEGW